MVWLRFFTTIALISCGVVAAAQRLAPPPAAIQASSPRSVSGAPNEVGIWIGYSPHSFVLQGTALHRQLFLLNLQYARRLAVHGPLTLKYLVDVVPVALEIQPTSYYIVHETVLKNAAGTVFGAGANPFGLRLNFGHRKLQPFVDSSAGFLYFNRQVPAPASSQFNFTFNFGGGLQIFSDSRRSFMLGYKYHHLSNAETGTINPGIDSNVIFVGFAIPGWKRAR